LRAVQYLNPETNVVIVRTSLEMLPQVWSSLTFLRTFKDKELVVVVVKAAPSLRTCKTVRSFPFNFFRNYSFFLFFL
jgi:RNase P/RNase MRP subunit POP5